MDKRDARRVAFLIGPVSFDSERLPNPNNDGTGQDVEDQTDEVVDIADGDSPTRFDEQVVAREVTEQDREQRGPVAAEPDGECDGSVEGRQWHVVAHERVEKPSEQYGSRRRRHRDKIADHLLS
jgi:hypothetical protein